METNACAAALLAELSQAKELLKELELNLHCLDLCKALTPRITSSIHNSILMAESFEANAGHDRPPCSSLALRPRTLTPKRRYVRNSHARSTVRMVMKVRIICRKSLYSWRCQVRVGTVAGGVEGPGEDDGFTWRKYGQKEILGAKYPRAYFRCAHRDSHSCTAKKQVQRSDNDPSVYDVTYHDYHTCLQQQEEEEEEQGGANAMQRDQEQSTAAEEKLEGEEEFVGKIAPSFAPLEEKQFFSASPYQFGSSGALMKERAVCFRWSSTETGRWTLTSSRQELHGWMQ
ncbi:transcription factor WRKY19-like isoform X1 [Zingiber officinale]|uniref:transcription factor WRKY19-like isoform X1 n=1 Tax=Zingiber officinale TaxID=94328 RepID=UPI001C4B76C8|nr:transcription factor WRKY19-like isoform X1 [Zingiber officinale]